MTGNVPQFGIAEYPSASGTDICKSCNQQAVGSYYRINGALACERCKGQLEAELPKDSHAAFVRGLIFGVSGAILGLILYSAFGIITGLEIGYISLAVGYIVGKAVRMGSRGIGGRRYQVVAVVLTYAAVSLSAIPIGVSQCAKEKQSDPQARCGSSTAVRPWLPWAGPSALSSLQLAWCSGCFSAKEYSSWWPRARSIAFSPGICHPSRAPRLLPISWESWHALPWFCG